MSCLSLGLHGQLIGNNKTSRSCFFFEPLDRSSFLPSLVFRFLDGSFLFFSFLLFRVMSCEKLCCCLKNSFQRQVLDWTGMK